MRTLYLPNNFCCTAKCKVWLGYKVVHEEGVQWLEEESSKNFSLGNQFPRVKLGDNWLIRLFMQKRSIILVKGTRKLPVLSHFLPDESLVSDMKLYM